MDLKTLENLANKSTGLVPLKVVQSFAPYMANTVHGFTPKDALSHLTTGHVVFPDPQVQETVMAEIVASKPAAASPVVTSKSLPDGFDPRKVEIPAEWKEFHFMKRLALAKSIDPNFTPPEGVKAVDHGDAVIEAELKIRGEQPKA